MRIKKSEFKKARIEIIPMIDTIFFLLVFFMIASLAMTKMEGVKVNLPKSTTSGKESVAKFYVTITSSGNLYVNKTPAGSIMEVENICREKLSDNPLAVPVINADKNVLHGRVIEVMDAVKRAGASRLMVATEPYIEDGKPKIEGEK